MTVASGARVPWTRWGRRAVWSLGAACAVWLGKWACLLAMDASSPVRVVLATCALACGGAGGAALARAQVGRMGASKPWIEAIFVASLFSLFTLVPFFPDAFSAFANEAPALASAWFVAALVASTFTLALFRAVPVRIAAGAASTVCRKAGRPDRADRTRFLRSGFLVLPLFWIFEGALFAVSPLLWWTSFPVPVFGPRSAALVVDSTGESGQPPSARDSLPRSDNAGRLVYLIDPRLSDAGRQGILDGGRDAARAVGTTLGGAIASDLGASPTNELFVVLPETTFYGDEAFLADVHGALSQALDADTRGVGLHLLAGLHDAGENEISYVGPSVVTGRTMVGTLRRKEIGVPLFERPVFGVRLRDTAESALGAARDVELRSEELHPLVRGLTRGGAVICYEALSYFGWRRQVPRWVFTNHFPFRLTGIASAVYDHNLRFVAALFDAPLILVGNFGTSGSYARSAPRPGTGEDGSAAADPRAYGFRALRVEVDGGAPADKTLDTP